MASVLMIGIDPDLVDFSDPALPPGMTADMIRAGIVRGLDDLRAVGHTPDHLYISTDPAGLGALADRLARAPVDCVIVGGGVRLPPRNLAVFEAALNTIAAAWPVPAIALVARPDEAADAVARALLRRGA